MKLLLQLLASRMLRAAPDGQSRSIPGGKEPRPFWRQQQLWGARLCLPVDQLLPWIHLNRAVGQGACHWAAKPVWELLGTLKECVEREALWLPLRSCNAQHCISGTSKQGLGACNAGSNPQLP